jgi:hypothetical protein
MRLLAAMPRLQALEVKSAPISDAGLLHLRRTRTLRSLSLGAAQPFAGRANPIGVTGEGFAALADLPEFTELEIHSNALTRKGLDRIGAIRTLKRLKLKGARIDDDDLRSLAALTDLESLEIMAESIDGTGFRHLSGLSRLSSLCLEGAKINDEALPYLARLPALESVMIYHTRVIAAGLEQFRNSHHLKQMGLIPGVPGDLKRLKRALPNCSIISGGTSL